MRRRAMKRKGSCRVFWGSHGCSKQRGHRGLHFCSNGCVPCDGPYIFGEDWDREAYIAEVEAWMEYRRQKGKGWPTHRPDDWRLPSRLHEVRAPADRPSAGALGGSLARARALGESLARSASGPVRVLPSACYDTVFGRVHVRPVCQCAGR